RRQAMTAREINAFDEMFSMIFDAVSDKKPPPDAAHAHVGIGGKSGISDLFGKLRRHSKRVKWTTQSDEILDRKKEAIDMCDTDHELLDWAMSEVFAESIQYEASFREAISDPTPAQELPMMQPPAYPHLIALLMRTFRDRYRDPHLALSIFSHAQNLSIASYVFGCSTHAYNELIETRWSAFRDLRGVHDALQEMRLNGVEPDPRTRKLVEQVRRDVGKWNLQADDDTLGQGGDIWNMLAKIEELASAPTSRPKKTKPTTTKPAKWDDWKTLPLDDRHDDTWGFDQWDKPK
ncbi:hypothetical protein BD779DRAFT_1396422, partial [Infundibulicybe gibba]